MKLVIVESPFRGNNYTEHLEHLVYLNRVLKDSIDRGEAPFASHALYPRVLDDRISDDRMLGIRMGYAWMQRADLVAFYIDRGWSEGMQAAEHEAAILGIPAEFRKLENK